MSFSGTCYWNVLDTFEGVAEVAEDQGQETAPAALSFLPPVLSAAPWCFLLTPGAEMAASSPKSP